MNSDETAPSEHMIPIIWLTVCPLWTLRVTLLICDKEAATTLVIIFSYLCYAQFEAGCDSIIYYPPPPPPRIQKQIYIVTHRLISSAI